MKWCKTTANLLGHRFLEDIRRPHPIIMR